MAGTYFYDITMMRFSDAQCQLREQSWYCSGKACQSRCHCNHPPPAGCRRELTININCSGRRRCYTYHDLSTPFNLKFSLSQSPASIPGPSPKALIRTVSWISAAAAEIDESHWSARPAFGQGQDLMSLLTGRNHCSLQLAHISNGRGRLEKLRPLLSWRGRLEKLRPLLGWES